MSASSDGRRNPPSPAASASTTNSTHTCGVRQEGRSRAARSSRARGRARSTRTIRRRSTASANAPPTITAQEQGRFEGDEREQAADDGGRAGQLVDLVRHGHVRELRAEERDGEADPEQAVLAVPAKRPEVDRRQSDELAPTALRNRRRGAEALGLVELLLVAGLVAY